MRRPSGLTLAETTKFLVLQWRTDGLSRPGVPDTRCVVRRDRDDPSSVRTEARRKNSVSGAAWVRRSTLRCIGVPHARRAAGSREDPAPVRTEDRGEDSILVLQGRPHGLSRTRVPHPRRVVAGGSDDATAVRTEVRGADGVLVPHGRPTGWPVSASHTRAVWSEEAVTIRRPSGLKTAQDNVVLMTHGLADGLSRCPRPTPAPCRRGRP